MRIFVCPVAHVADCYEVLKPERVLGLLSPGQDEAPLSLPRVQRLELRFNDIAGPQPGLIPPGKDDLQAILDFARGAESLLVYCFAGISRSTAAAFSIACRAHADQDETVVAAALRRLSPSATPNPLMVAYADEILRRDGRMMSAISAIGRGDGLFAGQFVALAAETISG